MAGLKFLDEETRLMRVGVSGGVCAIWREEHGFGRPRDPGSSPRSPACYPGKPPSPSSASHQLEIQGRLCLRFLIWAVGTIIAPTSLGCYEL